MTNVLSLIEMKIGVASDSNTPTFVSGRLTIDNFRWAGVPFYIRTGKRMKSKCIQVVVEFKRSSYEFILSNGSITRF